MSHTSNSSTRTVAQIIIGIKFNLSLKKKWSVVILIISSFNIFAKTVVYRAMSISPEVVSTFHYLWFFVYIHIFHVVC